MDKRKTFYTIYLFFICSLFYSQSDIEAILDSLTIKKIDISEFEIRNNKRQIVNKVIIFKNTTGQDSLKLSIKDNDSVVSKYNFSNSQLKDIYREKYYTYKNDQHKYYAHYYATETEYTLGDTTFIIEKNKATDSPIKEYKIKTTSGDHSSFYHYYGGKLMEHVEIKIFNKDTTLYTRPESKIKTYVITRNDTVLRIHQNLEGKVSYTTKSVLDHHGNEVKIYTADKNNNIVKGKFSYKDYTYDKHNNWTEMFYFDSKYRQQLIIRDIIYK